MGHGDLVTTARTYTHVVADETEIDYSNLLKGGSGAEMVAPTAETAGAAASPGSRVTAYEIRLPRST